MEGNDQGSRPTPGSLEAFTVKWLVGVKFILFDYDTYKDFCNAGGTDQYSKGKIMFFFYSISSSK